MDENGETLKSDDPRPGGKEAGESAGEQGAARTRVTFPASTTFARCLVLLALLGWMTLPDHAPHGVSPWHPGPFLLHLVLPLAALYRVWNRGKVTLDEKGFTYWGFFWSHRVDYDDVLRADTHFEKNVESHRGGTHVVYKRWLLVALKNGETPWFHLDWSTCPDTVALALVLSEEREACFAAWLREGGDQALYGVTPKRRVIAPVVLQAVLFLAGMAHLYFVDAPRHNTVQYASHTVQRWHSNLESDASDVDRHPRYYLVVLLSVLWWEYRLLRWLGRTAKNQDLGRGIGTLGTLFAGGTLVLVLSLSHLMPLLFENGPPPARPGFFLPR